MKWQESGSSWREQETAQAREHMGNNGRRSMKRENSHQVKTKEANTTKAASLVIVILDLPLSLAFLFVF